MVQPRGLQVHAVFNVDASGIDFVKGLSGPHLVQIDGKVGGGHLFGHDLLEAAGAAGGVEEKLAVRVVV